MARKNSIISASVDGNTLSIAVTDAGTITLDVSALSEEIRNRAMVHGLLQKVSDAAAISKSELPDNPTDAAKVKFEAMSAVASRLIEGEWSKRSGDGTGPVAGIIYRAFEEWVNGQFTAAKKPIPTAEATRAKYDAMDRPAQLALRNVPAIAAIIERMKSERGPKASTQPDVDSLLGELGL